MRTRAIENCHKCKSGERITQRSEVAQERVHSRGAVNWCQLAVGSGGSQGFPSMAVRMASSVVMPWAAAVSR